MCEDFKDFLVDIKEGRTNHVIWKTVRCTKRNWNRFL